MYCPKCATQNMDNARYCRSCGTDLDLVSKALTGQLQVQPPVEDRFPRRTRRGKIRDEDRPPSVEGAIQGLATGFAFILVSFAVLFYAPAGRIWWFWMLIPAFTMLGKGVAEYIKWKNQPVQLQGNQIRQPTVIAPPNPAPPLPPRPTSEMYTPPSATEGTTRHLDPAPQRAKDQS